VLFVVVTLASFGYNFATKPVASRPPGLTYVQAADVHTRYRTWGTSGLPIVLIPGAFETADTFDALARVLALHHRVFALDLTGTGYSDAVAPFTVEHFTAQVVGFITAMRLTGSNAPVVVGHSSGAAVAGLAALRDPWQIAGVMFLDGDALPLAAPSFLHAVFINPYRTTLFRLGLSSDWVVRTIYDSQCGPRCPKLDASGVEVWRRPLQQPGNEEALWSIVNVGIPSLTPTQTSELRAIPTPKSVVFGIDDPQFSHDNARKVAVRIGAPPTVFVPGRHLTMISSPDEVAAAIEQLVARTRG